MRKRTKIITTLGPSTTSPEILSDLISAGTDVFRLNLSHAKIDDAREILNKLKKSSSKLERPVAMLVDLQGQKIRTKGFLKEKFVDLKTNQKFVLDCSLKDDEGDSSKVGVTHKSLYKITKPKD